MIYFLFSGGSGHNTPNLMSASLPGNKRVGNFTAPSSQSITKKRKSPEVSLEAAPTDSNKGRSTAKSCSFHLNADFFFKSPLLVLKRRVVSLLQEEKRYHELLRWITM